MFLLPKWACSLPFCCSFSWACVTMAHCLDRTLKRFSTSPSLVNWLPFALFCSNSVCSCGRRKITYPKPKSSIPKTYDTVCLEKCWYDWYCCYICLLNMKHQQRHTWWKWSMIECLSQHLSLKPQDFHFWWGWQKNVMFIIWTRQLIERFTSKTWPLL